MVSQTAGGLVIGTTPAAFLTLSLKDLAQYAMVRMVEASLLLGHLVAIDGGRICPKAV
jgi:hypothetical protein